MRLPTAWQVSIIAFAPYEARHADLLNAEPEPLGTLHKGDVQGSLQGRGQG